MKCTSVIVAVLLIGSTNANAQSNDLDVLLGAAAGAAIGNTIGDGDGRRVATVVGGLIGAEMARNRSSGYANSRNIENHCRRSVPAVYRNNLGATKAWINGCIDRLEQQQAEIEQRAYEEALNQ